jgi:hypothetical protein
MNIRRGQAQQSLFKPCSGSVFGTPAMRSRALYESGVARRFEDLNP